MGPVWALIADGNSFEEARGLLVNELLIRNGEGYYIPEWGWENSMWLSIPYGDRGYLVDGNSDYQVIGPPGYFVNKLTGEVRAGSSASNSEFFFSEELDGMKPYGDIPSHFFDQESVE